MPELFPLQEELLRVLKKHAEGMFSKTCQLTSEELRREMRPKPSSEQYISRLLKSLQQKGKVKVYRKHVSGEGLKRIIEIL